MVMDIDVEELLEAPFRKTEPNISVSPQPSTARTSETAVGVDENGKPPSEKDSRRERDKDSRRDRESRRDRDRGDKERERRHRTRSRSGERDKRHKRSRRDRTRSRSRSPSPRSSRHRYRSRSRSPRSSRPRYERSRSRDRRRSGSMSRRGPRRDSHRASSPILSDWERDKRTVFVAQLAARCTTADLEEFFTAAGKVREARLITDRHSRRHKGVGYVEFYEEETVKKALEMKGQILLGIPIDVQLTESEKNRLAAEAAEGLRLKSEMSYNRLYVGSLHFNITEEDLKAVFEPFGPIEFVDLHKDPETGRSRGFAFIQYERPEDAKIALDKMNGFEIMGRSIRVGHITDKALPGGLSAFNLDESDAAGFTLNSFSRAELMAKLARDDMPGLGRKPAAPVIMPTRCILLKNMFGPEDMTEENWDKELEEDVQSECSKYGKVVHIAVEKDTEGHIYMKYNSIPEASAALQGLNGRFFGGKQIEAAYVVEAIYNARHPTATYV